METTLKKVLIITYYWPPSGGAGVQRWLKFCKYFSDYDVQPFVLTVDENYAEYPLYDESLESEVPDTVQVIKTKTWEPFTVYKKLTGKKTIQAGQVSKKDGGGVAGFLRANVFVPDPRMFWKRYALPEARRLIKEYGINNVITTGPPHSVHLIGRQLARELDINWISDFRDPWSKFMFTEQLNRLPVVQRYEERLERAVADESDKIITVTRRIERFFSSLTSTPVHYISNGYDIAPVATEALPHYDKYVLSYIGNFRETQDVQAFWTALKRLQEEQIISPSNFSLHLIGTISPRIDERIAAYGLEGLIRRFGYVLLPEAEKEMWVANQLLLILPQVSSVDSIVTGKIYDYLATRNPILAIGPTEGDLNDLLKECHRDECLKYTDEEGIYDSIKREFNYWKKNKTIRKVDDQTYTKYSRQKLTGQVAGLLLESE